MTIESTNDTLTKVVVLGGVEYGGTTVLLDMLRAHPRVFGPFEMGLLCLESLNSDGLIDWYGTSHAQAKILENTFGLTLYRLRELIREYAKGPNDWWSFYAGVFAHMIKHANVQGRDVLIDKKPDYANFLHTHVYPKMPDAPVLLIVRDPRAVYCSKTKRAQHQQQHIPVGMFLSYYTRVMRSAMRTANDGMPVMLVRFEDLVSEPTTQLEQVAQFIGICYDPAMASPANSYNQHVKTRFTYPATGPRRQQRPADLDKNAITEWRDMLRPGEADEVVAALPSDLGWTLADSGKALPGR